MKISDMNQFKNKMDDFAEKSGKYWENKVRAQPDQVIVQWAKEGKEFAQAEADRRGLSY